MTGTESLMEARFCPFCGARVRWWWFRLSTHIDGCKGPKA